MSRTAYQVQGSSQPLGKSDPIVHGPEVHEKQPRRFVQHVIVDSRDLDPVRAELAKHRVGERRFDMFEADYTHEGDRCTFETLVRRFRLRDPALRAIGEIVHDIDCKDGKFGRAATAGVEQLLAGIARQSAADTTRLRRGADVFDNLYESFAARRGAGPRDKR